MRDIKQAEAPEAAPPSWDYTVYYEPLDGLEVRKLLVRTKFRARPTPSSAVCKGVKVYVYGVAWATFIDAKHAREAARLWEESGIAADVRVGV